MLKTQHSSIDVVDCYSWIWDFIIKPAMKGERLPVDRIDVVGSRCSGKTMMFGPLLWILLCDYVDQSTFEFMCFRDSKEKAKMLLNDIVSILSSYKVNYTFKSTSPNMCIKYQNNIMGVYGLNSQKKNNPHEKEASGLPHTGNVKYCFVFFEERYEFQEYQISLIQQAIRSTNKNGVNTQYIYISVCNPWAKSHPYIEGLLNKQPFDIKKMERDGSQIGIYDNTVTYKGKDNQEIVVQQKQIIQYTNWRVVQQYLSDYQIAAIKDTYRLSKVTGMTVDLGYPGYESGGIYTEFLNKLTQSMFVPHQFLLGGVDYGWGRVKESGKTVALFMGASMDAGIDIYGEYSHSNADVAIDPAIEAENIVRFFINQMNQYIQKTGDSINRRAREVVVRVDRAEPAFITILNSKAISYNVNWLCFVPCKKYEVAERIMVTTALLAQDKLRINENTFNYPVKLLKKEFELAVYDDNKTIQTRTKKNDHSINAFEYAIEPLMTAYEADLRIGNIKKWY